MYIIYDEYIYKPYSTWNNNNVLLIIPISIGYKYKYIGRYFFIYNNQYLKEHPFFNKVQTIVYTLSVNIRMFVNIVINYVINHS